MRTIMATVFPGLIFSSLRDSRWTLRSASSSLPFRTKYHGLSGARVTSMNSGIGHTYYVSVRRYHRQRCTHWIANGMR